MGGKRAGCGTSSSLARRTASCPCNSRSMVARPATAPWPSSWLCSLLSTARASPEHAAQRVHGGQAAGAHHVVAMQGSYVGRHLGVPLTILQLYPPAHLTVAQVRRALSPAGQTHGRRRGGCVAGAGRRCAGARQQKKASGLQAGCPALYQRTSNVVRCLAEGPARARKRGGDGQSGARLRLKLLALYSASVLTMHCSATAEGGAWPSPTASCLGRGSFGVCGGCGFCRGVRI